MTTTQLLSFQPPQTTSVTTTQPPPPHHPTTSVTTTLPPSPQQPNHFHHPTAASAVTTSISTTKSFCQSEQMSLRCPHPSLILLSQARYGRMSLSKCVKEQFGGYLGCWSDVTSILDASCSGKQECSVKILEENFKHIRPCHDDLKSYLEVTYSCVSGHCIILYC